MCDTYGIPSTDLLSFSCFQFLFQLDSEGSRSGSSLSLRAVAPSAGGGSGGGSVMTSQNSSAPSPAHASAHRGVQRSISATSNKPRRGSTGADTAACELMSTTGNGKDPGSGRAAACVCVCAGVSVCVRARWRAPHHSWDFSSVAS